MASVTKKICVIGDFAVGKTSLVSRYIRNVFSNRYLTTVGVKIDTKIVTLPGKRSIKLVVWDIAGTDRFTTIDTNYLRGAAAYLLIVDGTRHNTLTTAYQLKRTADNLLNSPPCVWVFNKVDLNNEWEIKDSEIEVLEANDWHVLRCSAKEGRNVAKAFQIIAEKLIK